MKDTLFTVELPLIKTDEELEEIKKKYPKYDPYFITSSCCKERRERFDKLWVRYKPYADSHFLSQIKTNFHQRSWEMYVGNVFLEKGLKLKVKSKKEKQKGGPDFVIDEIGYIECVAPTKGKPDMSDSVPEMFIATKPEEIQLQGVPTDKMILRITNEINYKALDQYKKWEKKEWFDSMKPFIIAINTADLGHTEDPSMPNVLKALFGFQSMQINIKTGASNFSHRNEVLKANNKPVPVNYFVNQDFNFISSVLFSDKTVLNHPENIGDDCIFVNNPFAKNPVSNSFIKLFKNWTASKDEKEIYLKKNY